MRPRKVAVSVSILLCFFSAISVSVAAEAVYQTYDCESFSVEYPSGWVADRSLDAKTEGWQYTFMNPDGIGISLAVGAKEITLYSTTPLDAIEGGLLDASTRHFLDTLDFKIGSTAVASQTSAYKSYDGVYFSVEYPESWGTRTVPFERYDGQIYAFVDGTNRLSVTLHEFSSTDAVTFMIKAPRSSVGGGKFGEHVYHFVDTLHFKM
jgi:hypothetical protein